MKGPKVFKPGNVRAIVGVFRAALRRSDELRRVVKTWQLAEGLDTDDILPERWSAELFPVLRLDLEGLGGGFKTQATQQSRLELAFTLGVLGTDPCDASDFWEMAVGVVYPCDRSVLNAVMPYGVHGYEITTPAVTRRYFGESDAGQVVVGRVSIPYEYKARP